MLSADATVAGMADAPTMRERGSLGGRATAQRMTPQARKERAAAGAAKTNSAEAKARSLVKMWPSCSDDERARVLAILAELTP